MIAMLTGELRALHLTSVIVDVSGVGYQVFLTARDLDSAKLNHNATYFIYEHIRDDLHDLYGFSSQEDKSNFEQLLSVNGVGPKLALAITSSVNNLGDVIRQANTAVLQSVPGVGKRVAERIVVELKNKLGTSTTPLESAQAGMAVYEALLQLGFQSTRVHEVISKLPSDLESDEAKIKWALKEIGK